ncbi:hypothetical protein T492DRAFT_1138951 [Pavlovales sp. CCMP2436]|nr:hypothetical protein T492DRAFT_1138951 [Pavlovales sp. CCMP2436]
MAATLSPEQALELLLERGLTNRVPHLRGSSIESVVGLLALAYTRDQTVQLDRGKLLAPLVDLLSDPVPAVVEAATTALGHLRHVWPQFSEQVDTLDPQRARLFERCYAGVARTPHSSAAKLASDSARTSSDVLLLLGEQQLAERERGEGGQGGQGGGSDATARSRAGGTGAGSGSGRAPNGGAEFAPGSGAASDCSESVSGGSDVEDRQSGEGEGEGEIVQESGLEVEEGEEGEGEEDDDEDDDEEGEEEEEEGEDGELSGEEGTSSGEGEEGAGSDVEDEGEGEEASGVEKLLTPRAQRGGMRLPPPIMTPPMMHSPMPLPPSLLASPLGGNGADSPSPRNNPYASHGGQLEGEGEGQPSPARGPVSHRRAARYLAGVVGWGGVVGGL